MQQIFASLKKDGFININYPADVRNAVEETAKAWNNFCALDKSVKESFIYNDDLHAGYEFKGEAGLGKDVKENFHITQRGLSEIEEIANKNESAKDFIESGKRMIDAINPFVKEVLQKIEEESGISGLADRAMKVRDQWITRFLHYFPGMPAGHEIAAVHPDKGSITLHLYESADGLEYYWNGVWHPMPVGVDYTAAIGGMGLQYATKCEIKATNHRVVATEKTSKEGRYSMVMFIQLADIPGYDKERNGRLQDVILNKGLGFNYSMSFEEFKTFFKD